MLALHKVPLLHSCKNFQIQIWDFEIFEITGFGFWVYADSNLIWKLFELNLCKIFCLYENIGNWLIWISVCYNCVYGMRVIFICINIYGFFFCLLCLWLVLGLIWISLCFWKINWLFLLNDEWVFCFEDLEFG